MFFNQKHASKLAQEWANKNKEPFTVYLDPSKNYLAVELRDFQVNKIAYRNCRQVANFYPQGTLKNYQEVL